MKLFFRATRRNVHCIAINLDWNVAPIKEGLLAPALQGIPISSEGPDFIGIQKKATQ